MRPRSYSKLNARSVRAIRRARAKGVSYRVLARRYGVGMTTVAFAVRGWTWQWVN